MLHYIDISPLKHLPKHKQILKIMGRLYVYYTYMYFFHYLTQNRFHMIVMTMLFPQENFWGQ
jgi:hypothetical protein